MSTTPNEPKPTVCPICGHVLKEGESLAARYIPEHAWWVVYHVPADPKAEPHERKVDFLKTYCAKAGFIMRQYGVPTPL